MSLFLIFILPLLLDCDLEGRLLLDTLDLEDEALVVDVDRADGADVCCGLPPDPVPRPCWVIVRVAISIQKGEQISKR